MDGYDIQKNVCLTDYTGKTLETLKAKPRNVTLYRVYTWDYENNRTVKHYRRGYTSYKQMIAAHPELKG